MLPVKLEIVKHGDVIKAIEGKDKKELSLEFELDSGNGFWIAAKAEGSDGSFAHTTPVYVVREGLRFWKIEAVDKLIFDRMENLVGIEELIDRAKSPYDKNNNHAKLGLKLMIEQEEELRERISDAREFYENLGRIAKKERGIRQ